MSKLMSSIIYSKNVMKNKEICDKKFEDTSLVSQLFKNKEFVMDETTIKCWKVPILTERV